MCCLFSLVDSRLDFLFLMASAPEMTNEGTASPGEPFYFPSYRNIGPPHTATLSLPGLTIGLLVWLFSTQIIPNTVSGSVVRTSPQERQPHVDPSPSSPVRSSSPSSLARSSFVSSSSLSKSSKASNSMNEKKKKQNIKKKKINKGINFQPLPEMLENNQLLLIVRGVLMILRSPKQPVSPSTLTGFVRVTIFLRISLVYPRL
jgi:hypothetical protein